MVLRPPTDHATSVALVRRLLTAQAPVLAELPLAWLASGWDNDTYRLGDGLVVRLPRHDRAGDLLATEVRWLPELSESLTAPTPQPVFTGTASDDFPRPWTVMEYLPGRVATTIPPAERTRFAEDLADFVWSLHVPAHPHAPVNPVRGGSLATEATDALVRERLVALARDGEEGLATDLLARWEDWVGAPDYDGVDAWVHGDLHPHNLVVADDGRLAGVIDWGDLTAGDPSCDLATAWLTFDETGRRAFVQRLEQGGLLDAAAWQRAKAWALYLALVLLSRRAEHPDLAAIGSHTVDQLVVEGTRTS